MQAQIYDLIVIGGGSGGVRSARIASNLGAKVALIEKGKMGGTCVNVGCVPKKLFAYSAAFAQEMNLAKGYGWKMENHGIDWQQFIAKKNAEIQRLNQIYQGLLEKSNVEVLQGTGRLLGKQKVQVGERVLQAKYIILAVGGEPANVDPEKKLPTITSNEVFFLPQLPKKLLVLGGGYIALEFASIFLDFGCQVQLAYRGDLFLKHFDYDIREKLKEELIKKGLDYRPQTTMTSANKANGAVTATFHDGRTEQFDIILSALGRKPALQGLGLENTKVRKLKNGKIAVNPEQETDEPGVFAIGDISSPAELTPVAIREGHYLVQRLFSQKIQTIDYTLIPTAVFTNPALGVVGLTQQQAEQAGHKVKVLESSFAPMKNSFGGSATKCYLKVVVSQQSDKVLGVHLLGSDAPESVQGFTLALKMGATLQDLHACIGIHPSTAEEIFTLQPKTA